MKLLLMNRGTDRPFLVHANGGSLIVTIPKESGFKGGDVIYQYRGLEGQILLSTITSQFSLPDIGYEFLKRNTLREHARKVPGKEYQWFRLALSSMMGMKAGDYVRFYKVDGGVLVEKARKQRAK
jgi:hypothetical protein